jgi:activating signal cointegrator complex subunit 2
LPEYSSIERRNVFDYDVFDLKQVDPSQIHRGRKERGTAMDLLNDKKFMQSQKAKIIQAAETQWDEYEDEYDDTYDDAERTIARSANPRLKIIRDDVDEETTESEVDDDVEGIVYKWFKNTPEIFEKSARKTKDRDSLKEETKWTDEQIEGWKSMIERDSSMLRRLETKYEHQVFQQIALPSTSWKAPENEEDVESYAERGGARRRGGGRGGVDANISRGRGRGHGRGRGRGVEKGRAKKDRIRSEYRPDA